MKTKSIPWPMSNVSMFIIPMLVCLFNAALIAYPREVFAAAKEGVGLWFNNVLPSLLPFMIGINMLNGTGFSIFLGELLAPVMRIVFGLPGAGGFALLSGLTSGYPMGAKVTAELCVQGRLTQEEAQRLVGFCNNAGPLFIIGVAGIGLFNSAAAGYCLWFAHAAAAITVGILLRLTATNKRLVRNDSKKRLVRDKSNMRFTHDKNKQHLARDNNRLLPRAYHAFTAYRRAHDGTFGFVLSAGVQNAMTSVTIIGGYIIFFCVLSHMLTLILDHAVAPGGAAMLLKGSLSGILEMTNGVKLLANAAMTSPAVPHGAAVVSRDALAYAAAIISFGGFSIHAQTLHFLRGSGIHPRPYIESKVLHGLLAFVYCRFFYRFFDMGTTDTVPAMGLWRGVVPYTWRPAIALTVVAGFALLTLWWAAVWLYGRRRS